MSADVLAAYGNMFTNKYSEGYPGARYYGGQEWVDQLERLTQHRALRVFGLLAREKLHDESNAEESQDMIEQELADALWAVNVQSLSGGPANAAVYIGFLRA